MSIGLNKVVTMNYTLKDEAGEVLDSSAGSVPFTFISGNNQILPKLEEAVDMMVIGSKKKIKIEAAEGYGLYNEDAIQQVNRKEFPEEVELEVGIQYMARSQDGKQMPFIISKVEGDDVTLDFNHPLAGKNLEFEVELMDIRDASAEEIAHGHVHGGDGHHH